MSRSNSLKVYQSREIGRKVFATDGPFPGFSSATTLACRQIFGIFLASVQLLKKRSSQSRASGPNCLISSVWMSSRPGALPFFSTMMPMSSSAAINALVNLESSRYRCRSRRTFSCLFGTLQENMSWCATWFAVVLQCCFGLHESSQSLRVVDHAFLLSWVFFFRVVGHVDSIRVCHALRRSSEMALISSSPSVMVLSAKGSSSYFSLYSLISSMDSGVRPGTSFYTHEECYFGRLFVGRSRTGHSIRLWRGCSPRLHRADMHTAPSLPSSG